MGSGGVRKVGCERDGVGVCSAWSRPTWDRQGSMRWVVG